MGMLCRKPSEGKHSSRFGFIRRKSISHLKENKYGTFDWGLSGVNANPYDNLVPNPENQTSGSCFFI